MRVLHRSWTAPETSQLWTSSTRCALLEPRGDGHWRRGALPGTGPKATPRCRYGRRAPHDAEKAAEVPGRASSTSCPRVAVPRAVRGVRREPRPGRGGSAGAVSGGGPGSEEPPTGRALEPKAALPPCGERRAADSSAGCGSRHCLAPLGTLGWSSPRPGSSPAESPAPETWGSASTSSSSSLCLPWLACPRRMPEETPIGAPRFCRAPEEGHGVKAGVWHLPGEVQGSCALCSCPGRVCPMTPGFAGSHETHPENHIQVRSWAQERHGSVELKPEEAMEVPSGLHHLCCRDWLRAGVFSLENWADLRTPSST